MSVPIQSKQWHGVCHTWVQSSAGIPMEKNEVLDLMNLEWPASLLRFNEALRDHALDSILEVRIRDPRVVESVKTIVRNIGCQITGVVQLGDCYRILIRGNRSLPPDGTDSNLRHDLRGRSG
jgi:TusA-related sulfurtransferase